MALYGSCGSCGSCEFVWFTWLLWVRVARVALVASRCAFRSRAKPGDGKRASTRADRWVKIRRKAIWGRVRGAESAGTRCNTPMGPERETFDTFKNEQAFRSRRPPKIASSQI